MCYTKALQTRRRFLYFFVAWTILEDDNDTSGRHVGRTTCATEVLAVRNDPTAIGRTNGIKFQQIQKYETGANRVSSSRLWDISEVMEVQLSFFFEGLAEVDGDTARKKNILEDKEALDLIRCYYAIPEDQRKRLFDLARVLSHAA